MIRCVTIVAAGLATVSLAGCLTADLDTHPLLRHRDVSVWAHFDACSDRASFHEWVTCAKLNRDATCTNTRACTVDNEFKEVLAYAEELDLSVRRRQLSEPEARSKWAAYRADRDHTLTPPQPPGSPG